MKLFQHHQISDNNIILCQFIFLTRKKENNLRNWNFILHVFAIKIKLYSTIKLKYYSCQVAYGLNSRVVSLSTQKWNMIVEVRVAYRIPVFLPDHGTAALFQEMPHYNWPKGSQRSKEGKENLRQNICLLHTYIEPYNISQDLIGYGIFTLTQSCRMLS